MIRISKEFKFCAAHMLERHSGQCINLHGHSYVLRLTIEGDNKSEIIYNEREIINNERDMVMNEHKAITNERDMVIDFTDLSKVVAPLIERLDHSFLHYSGTSDTCEKEIAKALTLAKRKINRFDFRPTVEKLAEYIFSQLADKLGANCKLCCVRLYESDTSYAEYFR